MEKIEKALRILGVIADTHKLFFADAVTKDARAELAQLKENLRGIEWRMDGMSVRFHKNPTPETVSDYAVNCPVCNNNRAQGHSPDCWLAKIIGGE